LTAPTPTSAAPQIELFDGRDVDALAEAFTDLHRHYLGDAAPTAQAVAANLRDHVLAASSGVRIAVARVQGRIAGLATFAILYPAPGARGQLFMKDLFVRDAFRGQGLGEALMGFLARHAVAHDCVRLDWTTETGNPGAMAFYDRLGATRVTEKVYYRIAGEQLERFARGDGAQR
jgi:ribosomal protein S18 acetylase RimI-like enzyme